MPHVLPVMGTQAFDPTSISGLVAWYDFSDGGANGSLYTDTGRTTHAVNDGDLIKGVTDKSASLAHLSEATTPPTLKLAIKNGRSVGRFNSVGTTRLATSVAALVNAASGNDVPMTVYAVWQTTGNTGSVFYSGWGSTTDASRMTQGYRDIYDAVGQRAQAATTVTAVTAGATAASTWYVTSWVFPGTTVSTWRNNTLVINAQAYDVISTTFNRFTVGAEMQTGTFFSYIDGDIGELEAYTGAHSAAARVSMQNYIAARWAVTLA